MFSGMKDILRENMGGNASASLKKLDSLYPGFKTLTTAAHNAYGGGGLTLDILKAASKNVGSKGTKAAYGAAPLQAEIDLGIKTVGQYTPNILFDVIKGLAQNISSPTRLLEKSGRVLMGQTKPQRYLAGAAKRTMIPRAINRSSKALNVNVGTIAAGLEQ
jgi:hypothetical protein